jgi:prolyl-tRNA synthetase
MLILMLISKLLGERHKEKPADTTLTSHILLIRGGYVRQVSNGIFSMLTPAKRVAMKIEKIIREEMDNIEGQEVLLPLVLPAKLWEETGRYAAVGQELLRVTDRNEQKMVLGMTHEEAAVHLARTEAKTYSKYPFMIYQIQTKFRDEPRSRGGLIRVREFTMKDAYSFHTSEDDLSVYYDKVHEAYETIYKRIGLKNVISVGSDTGMMGGSMAHEFMFLSGAGEDSLVLCANCGYKSNMEVAVSKIKENEVQKNSLKEVEEVNTPMTKDIKSLSVLMEAEINNFSKTVIYAVEDSVHPLIIFIRGDLEVNESKVKNLIGKNIVPFTDYASSSLAFGYIGPYNLNEPDATILYDVSLKGGVFIGGANKKDYHFKGIDISKITDTFVDVSKVNSCDSCINCNAPLEVVRGIEVGNIFKLGTKYTSDMNMTYTDASGDKKTPTMGCYGIGIGRTLACLIEENHDDRGPIWPISVAPWSIQICMINTKIEEVLEVGTKVYNTLKTKYEVIMDDRNLSAGVQFAEADLLGVPIRLIISKKNLENNEIEVVTRDKTINSKVLVNDIENYIKELICKIN